MYRNKSIQEKLMFVFSADNLSQTYRRLRYVQEYANYQRLQAVEIERKQKQIESKKMELEDLRIAKEKLLKEGEAEKKKLERQEKEKQNILTGLKRKQRGIQNEINKKRRSADKLNAQIDRLIELEIEKARKSAEAARKGSKTDKKVAEKVIESPKTKLQGMVDQFSMNGEDRELSGSFESNKGKLPMPITGPYVIVGHYGQYAVTKNVRLDNKGIDIRGQEGAKARAIFDGEVSAIFKYNGMNNVLVRHGNYISVYCNLSSVSVTKGNKVKAKGEIGVIHRDESGNVVLHFQLRKETAKLNPEVWLGR